MPCSLRDDLSLFSWDGGMTDRAHVFRSLRSFSDFYRNYFCAKYTLQYLRSNLGKSELQSPTSRYNSSLPGLLLLLYDAAQSTNMSPALAVIMR